MIGPPGSGKSMMAKRLPSILPPLALTESLETTQIHSIAGKLKKNTGLITQRPFRSPHHTISEIALVGGGTNPMPGEITLAHNGVLFCDELPEFSKHTLEVLRPVSYTHLAHNEKGYKYFICKNSWGKNNPFGGFMYLSYNYVRLKTIAAYMVRV